MGCSRLGRAGMSCKIGGPQDVLASDVMASLGRRSTALAAAVAALLLAPVVASAHAERASIPPGGNGTVPTYRPLNQASVPHLVVCSSGSAAAIAAWPDSALKRANQQLLRNCRYSDLQDAVDAVTSPGTNIYVLPGTYYMPARFDKQTGECAALTGNKISYVQQLHCPHYLNWVAILGDEDATDADASAASTKYDCDRRLCQLQIEGTGRTPDDVILDGQFKKLNVIRADRADGIYFRNFAVEHSQFNGVYVMESDGYVIDSMLGRWNDEYAFLTFSVDHGLYTNCEGYGNGDSAVYPGGQAQRYGARPVTEVKGCRMHHNAIGLSGTGGDSLYVHDNWFYDNGSGITNDSLYPNHPGEPQNSAVYVNNHVFSNNEDFTQYARDGTCNKPFELRGYDSGVVCPSTPVPVGTGFTLAGGNFNVYGYNYIYDNWRWGTVQLAVPAALRQDSDPAHQLDTSHANRYYHNFMNTAKDGSVHPNGLDFWWDEEGVVNCWQDNLTPRKEGIVSDPPYNTEGIGSDGRPTAGGYPASLIPTGPGLPVCDQTPTAPTTGKQSKIGFVADCANYDLHTNPDPSGCPWLHQPAPPPGYSPTGQGPAPGKHAPGPQGWANGPTGLPGLSRVTAAAASEADAGAASEVDAAAAALPTTHSGSWTTPGVVIGGLGTAIGVGSLLRSRRRRRGGA
jgi:hypothetical protein